MKFVPFLVLAWTLLAMILMDTAPDVSGISDQRAQLRVADCCAGFYSLYKTYELPDGKLTNIGPGKRGHFRNFICGLSCMYSVWDYTTVHTTLS